MPDFDANTIIGNDAYKENSESVTIEGLVEHIIFHNEENAYCVAELSVNEEELITIVGTMPFISAGESIKAIGQWTVNPKFGKQFKIEYFEKQLPNTADAILKYLSSRAIKGIGPTTAAKIVGRFGEDSFDVIENHPEWLADISGISAKKAADISEEFKKQFGVRQVMMFCRDYFGPATAVKVYKRWGGSSIDVIKENPYALCDEIYGIGFERADKIAASLGIKADSDYRIMAALKYILDYNASKNGHCFIPEAKLIALAVQMLDISKDAAVHALESMTSAKKLISVRRGGESFVYLPAYYNAETYTAQKLDMLDRLCPKINVADIERTISLIEAETGIEYASMQRKAIINAVNCGVMVLTGGPGTGKTTVIRAVLRIFDRIDAETALCAPTGRAAKRMSDSTSREAKTIHRLLEMDYADDANPRFNRDENNPLDENVIIIDETSMVDISLMASLLKAIRPGSRLILIGDSDQLPSVGAGNVLRDIISSERFMTIRLKEIFRQAGESMIVTNAHAINLGELPNLDKKDGDFFFITRDSDSDIAKTVADLCVNRLPRKYGEEIRENIQIITPSRKGEAGTSSLNSLMQSVINPPAKGKKEKKLRDFIIREGDKVMQIKNNYDIVWDKDGQEGIGIFNGDIGIVREINNEEESLTISFDDRRAVYDFSMLDELDLAYAITVHKSQGSEYPFIVIPLYGFAPQLMTRNLLYTAVTRAQEMVVLVGRKEIVAAMVENDHRAKRYSALSDLLRAYDYTEEELAKLKNGDKLS